MCLILNTLFCESNMDKDTRGGRKTPKPKVLGANPLQGDVSWLVGGIVEKGVSENTPLLPPPAPRPTVLPFPAARHRSHGPVCLCYQFFESGLSFSEVCFLFYGSIIVYDHCLL